MYHEPEIPKIEIRLVFRDVVHGNYRRADERLQMPHGLHGTEFLRLRQKQKPVELGLLPRKADVLRSNAEKRNGLPQTGAGIVVIHAHGGSIDRLPDAAHGAEGGENRLRGRAELVGDCFGGQTVRALCPHDAQRRRDHLVLCKLVFRSH